MSVKPIERKFTLHVPSSTENLAMVREFVAAVGQRAGFDEQEVARLELAVDEACTNVIEHAYGHDATKEVTVRAVVDRDELRIDVVDVGPRFDPTSVPPADVRQLARDRKSGGLGLQVIRSVMDEVRYEGGPGEGNSLQMIKRLRRP